VRLGSGSGRSPTVIEIAQYLSLDTEQVIEALDAINARAAVSLDAPIGNDATGEAMSSHDTVGAEDDRYQLIDIVESLAAAVGRLSVSDREVFVLRFGNGLKQREIADRIGVSQMQVSRVLRRITEQLGDDLQRARPVPIGSLPAGR
jgi:RNA polymerase sigma-B factor